MQVYENHLSVKTRTHLSCIVNARVAAFVLVMPEPRASAATILLTHWSLGNFNEILHM